MTLDDLLQARFEVGDEVSFRLPDGTRIKATILKLNRRTATVAKDSRRWRVPYRLIDSEFDEARAAKHHRLIEVAREARQLMDRHGLAGWTFQFSAARRRLGLCNERERIIQLSRHHAANDPPMEVTDTLLHEIAHALAGTAAGHGPAWRRAAKQVGAKPRASKTVNPAEDESIKASLHLGVTISFRFSGGQTIEGTIIKLNRKTARVSSGGRLFLVPYGAVNLPSSQVPAKTSSGTTTSHCSLRNPAR